MGTGRASRSTVGFPDVVTFGHCGRQGDPMRDLGPPRCPSPEAGDRRHNRIKILAAGCAHEAGVDGCGVSVRDSSGNTLTMHATDTVAAALEDLQLTLGEGPCVDVATSGSPVLVSDLRDRSEGVADRWPVFLTEASGLGVRAVFAFPVCVGAVFLGAVDLYRAAPGSLNESQLAATLTTVDTIGHHLLGVDDPAAGGGSSSYSLTVHQAAGMVMVQLGSTIEEALMRLRGTAYAAERPVGEVAIDVVAGLIRFGSEQQ